jgi:hypothetical protein
MTPTPPLPVSSLQTSGLTSSGVTLNWQNNATNANNIVIMRQLESDSSQFVVSLPATATSFVDTNLLPGRAYDYNVAAMNLAGPSTGDEVNIQTVPLAPAGLGAIAGGNEAYLTWTPEGHAVGSYNIYRSTTSNGEVKVASNVTGSGFTDTGLTAGQTYFYKITAVDTGGESALSTEVSVTPVAPFVAGRHVFYNNSSFDGNDPTPTAADDNAIAPDKSALLPGQAATAANFTSFVHGLNGIMIDISGLGNAGALNANDFTFMMGTDPNLANWTAAPAPADVNVRAGAGPNGADRITIDWGDNQIQNTWLQLTVKADANTGLIAPDVFYFGNLIGDANGSGSVTVADIAMTKSQSGQAADPTSPTDFNRSGQVTVADIAIAKAYQGNSIPLFAAPAAAPAAAPSAISTTALATTATALPPAPSLARSRHPALAARAKRQSPFARHTMMPRLLAFFDH